MTSTRDPHADITQWLDAHCHDWNADDVPGMFRAAAPDLHWVNVVGMHWQGLDEAVAAHVAFFRHMFAGVPLERIAIESVTPISADVRVAVVHWRLGDYVVPTGETVKGEENRMSLVFSGQGDALRLRHVANVRIDPVAAAHDPVRRLR
ncbi:MAG: SgcJ/EcaC family oxidoreductase [Sphingomonas sp.]|nr:SgcJ/EcaC family oxidoreductase [Sphingomonas sp.]